MTTAPDPHAVGDMSGLSAADLADTIEQALDAKRRIAINRLLDESDDLTTYDTATGVCDAVLAVARVALAELHPDDDRADYIGDALADTAAAMYRAWQRRAGDAVTVYIDVDAPGSPRLAYRSGDESGRIGADNADGGAVAEALDAIADRFDGRHEPGGVYRSVHIGHTAGIADRVTTLARELAITEGVALRMVRDDIARPAAAPLAVALHDVHTCPADPAVPLDGSCLACVADHAIDYARELGITEGAAFRVILDGIARRA